MKTFRQIVANEQQVGFISPDLRDLTMVDGSRWYVRLRHGIARLARDDREDPEAVTVEMISSDGSFASREEFEQTFMYLAARHPGMADLVFDEVDAIEEFGELPFRLPFRH